MNNFRERLEDFLIEHDMSKNQLATIVGVRPDTIYGYYRKKLLPEIHIAKRIADHFNCSLDYLFGLTDQVKNNEKNDLSFADTIKKLIKDNHKSVEKTMKELNKKLGQTPVCYHLVHCGGRRAGIDARINEVAKAVKKVAGTIPFIMEFTFGEYGYEQDGRNTCGGLMLSFTAFA